MDIMTATTLELIGEENFRATVLICPTCMGLFDATYKETTCDHCEVDLVVRKVGIVNE